MDPGATCVKLIGHTEDRPRTGGEDLLVDAQSAQRFHAGGHDALATRFVAGESSAIHEHHVVATSGKQQGGCRAARPSAHDDGLGLHHAGTLAERAGGERIAQYRTARIAGG